MQAEKNSLHFFLKPEEHFYLLKTPWQFDRGMYPDPK